MSLSQFVKQQEVNAPYNLDFFFSSPNAMKKKILLRTHDKGVKKKKCHHPPTP